MNCVPWIAAPMFLQSIASACTCLAPSVEDALSKADFVVVGTVKNVTVLAGRRPIDSPVVVSIDVTKSFKEQKNGSIVLHTTTSKRGCSGYAFAVTRTYLIYVRYSSTRSWLSNLLAPAIFEKITEDRVANTSACWGTREFGQSSETQELQLIEKLLR